jgi:hypothetical protein
MKKNNQILLFILIVVQLVSCTKNQFENNLIPQVKSMRVEGEGFLNFKNFSILSNIDLDINFLSKSLEYKKISNGELVTVYLKKSKVKNPLGYKGAYKIDINNQINIYANDYAGFLYAFKTLNQLISFENGENRVPKLTIEDWASFQIRGYMQDVGRNYQSLELLKEQIDIMSDYKMNVFHMHITDNPSWRFESKIYPQLNDPKFSSRKPTKYYTHKDLKELIQYCKERAITLIPEFDLPGHTQAFRNAFGIKSMNSEKVKNTIIDLLDELCEVTSKEDVPYIHLGTDEARHKEEFMDEKYLEEIFQHLESKGRKVISWRPGINVKTENGVIKQIWTGTSKPVKNLAYIDSRANYINHLDPIAGIYRLFYQQACRQEQGDQYALGGILCCWHDDRIEEERNILKQNPIYSSIVAYSEAIWSGKKRDYKEYWSKLPYDNNSNEFKEFEKFERKLLFHRDNYFKNKEFQYVKNSGIEWRIIGPFDHKGKYETKFPVENDKIKTCYNHEGKEYKWFSEKLYGGTVHLNHFFGFPSPIKQKVGTVYAYTKIYSPKEQTVDFWIGFHGWSRAGGRRGGPSGILGEWHHTKPKIWVNDVIVNPPKWKNPNVAPKSPEIPLIDEDYFYREPTQILLKEGWNKVLLKIPHTSNSFKWMYNFMPIRTTNNGIREVDGLKFSGEL